MPPPGPGLRLPEKVLFVTVSVPSCRCRRPLFADAIGDG